MDRCLLILGCSRGKLVEFSRDPVLALDLYRGPRFGLLRNWIVGEADESQTDQLDAYALSGKYGLVNIWDRVVPYNLVLNKGHVERMRPVIENQVQELFGSVHYSECLLVMGPLYRLLILSFLRKCLTDTNLVIANHKMDSQGLQTMGFWLRAIPLLTAS